MSEYKDILARFKKAIDRTAKELDINPRFVTSRQYRTNKPGICEKVLARVLGGFTAAVDLAFPPEPSPFYRYQDLGHAELHELIGTTIAECAQMFKVEPHELTWYEYRRYIGHRYGRNDIGLMDYGITKAGGYNTVRDASFAIKPTPITVNKLRAQEHASINRKLGREDAQVQFTLNQITEQCERIFTKAYSITVCCNKYKPVEKTNQTLVAVFSDTHYGSDINGQETGVLSYGPVEEARRTAHFVKEIAGFDLANRATTDLIILINGDIIQGQLHDPRDGAVIAEQIERAMRILVQAITWLSAHFPKVKVIIQTGNHDRITSVHPKRAVNQKWNSFLTIIGMSLKYAIEANTKNVEFEMAKTPYSTFEVQGQKVFATHGDTVLTLRHNSIPVAKLAEATTRINSTLQGCIYDVYIAGHIHSGTYTALPNGSNLYTNPSLCPSDPFAVSLGSMQSNCGQWLLVFKEGEKDPVHNLV
jgi:predicted phosphodiesterase